MPGFLWAACDEADIRPPEDYIGAMPGRIINALQQAGSRNALILVDEIDKMASDFRGDLASALLEVFDTEQNHAFRDHFVELPLISPIFCSSPRPTPWTPFLGLCWGPDGDHRAAGYTVGGKVQIASAT